MPKYCSYICNVSKLERKAFTIILPTDADLSLLHPSYLSLVVRSLLCCQILKALVILYANSRVSFHKELGVLQLPNLKMPNMSQPSTSLPSTILMGRGLLPQHVHMDANIKIQPKMSTCMKWQKRHPDFKIFEVGLMLHPLHPFLL